MEIIGYCGFRCVAAGTPDRYPLISFFEGKLWLPPSLAMQKIHRSTVA